jgi:hypothetical protein
VACGTQSARPRNPQYVSNGTQPMLQAAVTARMHQQRQLLVFGRPARGGNLHLKRPTAHVALRLSGPGSSE